MSLKTTSYLQIDKRLYIILERDFLILVNYIFLNFKKFCLQGNNN